MDRLKKIVLWGSGLMLLSCSNLSNFCSHADTNNFSFSTSAKAVSASTAKDADVHDDSEVHVAPAPSQLTWTTLKEVRFESKFNKDFGTYFQYPVFNENLKKLHGKTACLAGFMIPLDMKNGLYALSKFNYASCFFCGKSGPESVVSLKFANTPRKYKTDEYLTMKGEFELNATNVNEFIYIFRKTEEYKP